MWVLSLESKILKLIIREGVDAWALAIFARLIINIGLGILDMAQDELHLADLSALHVDHLTLTHDVGDDACGDHGGVRVALVIIRGLSAPLVLKAQDQISEALGADGVFIAKLAHAKLARAIASRSSAVVFLL